jgi:predicted ribosome quality control (RQC) complex YloA/Tae2 family protein
MGKESKNFRKLVLSSGIQVLAGKNAEMNEKVIEQTGKNEYVLHTKAPGSPFCNIKEEAKKVSKEDLYETAVFCAKYSQAWKKSRIKKDIEVHVFLGKDIFKTEGMKTGTFGVKKIKDILVKKEDIEQ